MNRTLIIRKKNFWYQELVGQVYDILDFDPTLGFLVEKDDMDSTWYVAIEDCEIHGIFPKDWFRRGFGEGTKHEK